jgi:two-component system sensor histidine kinase YesM
MISYNLTSAINKMNRLLKRFGIDNMEIVFPEESSIQEIRELGASFNEMVIRTESLLDQLLISTKKQNELETKRNEAEMIALQAQINPHFIYNTFESINSLIAVGDGKNAMRMLNCLSDMLRFGAASGNAVVTLSEELLYVKTYVEIMKMRFGENIFFNIHTDENILQCKTIKLKQILTYMHICINF